MCCKTVEQVYVSDGKVYVDGWGEDPLDLEQFNKLTVTGRLSFLNNNGYSKDFANIRIRNIPSKLDMKNVKFLKLDHQAFKTEDVKKFQNVQEVRLYNNDIKKEDGINADPADIFKLLKNVKRFIFRHESNMFKKETAANLLKEPHFAKLEQLILHNVTPEFDFHAFLNGLLRVNPNINCCVYFKPVAFTNAEREALKQKIRRFPPTMLPKCNFGEMSS